MAKVDWRAAPNTPGLKVKWADGWIEDFPEDEFAEDCTARPRRIFMYKKNEACVLIEYTLTVSGRMAYLDYGGDFETANSKPGRDIYIGIAKIDFTDDTRTTVRKLTWREKGALRFIDYAPYVSWAKDPAAKTKVTFKPPRGDRRRRAQLSSVLRPGQMRFRATLLGVYGGKCAITGCAVAKALEAAHIMPYLGNEFDHIQNGLLLRADLHRLFDARLFSIDPKSLKIVLGATLRRVSAYENLEGQSVALPSRRDLKPAMVAIKDHWANFDRAA